MIIKNLVYPASLSQSFIWSLPCAHLGALLGALLVGFSSLAPAAPATLPLSPRELMQKSVAEMKLLPDVKVTLAHKLTVKDLKDKSETELSLMRNSIFAQAGVKFSDPWLKNYFTSRSWYDASKPHADAITQVDRDNAKMILAYQKSHNLVAFVQKPVQTRVAAGQRKPEVKLSDIALRKAILGAKYCSLYNEDGLVGELRFHHDNTVEISNGNEFSEGAYASSYAARGSDSAYGPNEGPYSQNEGAYSQNEGAYGADSAYSNTNSIVKAKWAVVRGHINYITGGQRTTLYFAADSFKAHSCFTSSSILF